jgi:hypothetical protein
VPFAPPLDRFDRRRVGSALNIPTPQNRSDFIGWGRTAQRTVPATFDRIVAGTIPCAVRPAARSLRSAVSEFCIKHPNASKSKRFYRLGADGTEDCACYFRSAVSEFCIKHPNASKSKRFYRLGADGTEDCACYFRLRPSLGPDPGFGIQC